MVDFIFFTIEFDVSSNFINFEIQIEMIGVEVAKDLLNLREISPSKLKFKCEDKGRKILVNLVNRFKKNL